jgi:methylthioribose-1-phosphate isomerase
VTIERTRDPVAAVESALPQVVGWDDVSRCVMLLDQTKLPGQTIQLRCDEVREVWEAIRRLSVRGAPAIGIAAAYGVCLAARGEPGGDLRAKTFEAIESLATSRPTAVNLFWALDRMRARARATPDDRELFAALLDEARRIHQQDRELCKRIGEAGADLFDRLLAASPPEPPADDAIGILTHCNAGALATGGIGTALAPVYVTHARGRSVKVYADETRPLLQGARLTAWELRQVGLPVTVITDSMAGPLLRSGVIRAVIVGADRIAASGDVANKIGTYSLAVLARHHGVPFFVAAPHSTFDMTLADGDGIPIEHRHAAELGQGFVSDPLPHDCQVWNPAFDVTPAGLITAIITDAGVIESPDTDKVAQWYRRLMA